MPNQFSRTERLLGKAAMEHLGRTRVAVFGIGGVGSYAAEALVRGGVGAVDLIDDDTVCLSNLNRQLFATHPAIGQYKVDVAARRLAEINPDAVIRTHRIFFTPDTADRFDFSAYDYVIDAIDTVSGKLALVVSAKAAGTPIISAMGAGNKLDPTAFEVTDIAKTSVCPLAKVMRTELRKRHIRGLKVVYSRELPLTPQGIAADEGAQDDASADTTRPGAPRRQVPGSTSFVPPVVGLILAGEVIKDLTGVRGRGPGL